MLRILSHTIFLCAIAVSAVCQGPRFYAESEAKQVTTNNFFQVSFVLENLEGSDFSAPEFGGLTVISGPSVSNEMKIINGRSSSKMSYVYGLMAEKAGNYTIGSASIRVNNKRYRTDPLQIVAVKGRAVSELKDEEQAFFRIESSDSIGYIGQQIRLDYVLYATKEVRAQSIDSESTFDGFYSQIVRDFRVRPEKVILNDVQYTREIIRTISLFPQQTGSYTINPATIRAAVPIEGARSRGLFFGAPTQRKYFKTNGLQILVKSLKSLELEQPDSFSGAVGKFNMQCQLNTNRVEAGDAVTLLMQISGNGDPKLLTAPGLEPIPGLDYFEPNLIEDQSREDGGSVLTTKTWEYLIVPEQSGRYRINPSFSYFNPDSSRYITIYRGPYDIFAGQASDLSSDLSGRDMNTDIKLQPLYLSSSWTLQNQRFFRSPTYWLLCGIIIFGLIAIILYHRYLRIQEGKDLRDVKALKARKMAVKRLKKSQKYMKEGDERAFYDEVSKAMLGYISDKLRMPAADLSKANVEAKMNELNIPAQEILSFIEGLQACELALYARKPEGGMEAMYNQAIKSISAVEENLNKG